MTLSVVPELSERGLRELPASVEAEQALLGAIMLSNKALNGVAGFRRDEHFSLPVHGRIYGAAQTLIGRGEVANPVTLARYFQSDEALCDVGGPQYLARLAGAAVTIVNAPDYGRDSDARRIRGARCRSRSRRSPRQADPRSSRPGRRINQWRGSCVSAHPGHERAPTSGAIVFISPRRSIAFIGLRHFFVA